METLIAPVWKDYALLDTGDGKRLERFGKYILVRPDPQIIWEPHLSQKEWNKADAVFVRDSDGREHWIKNASIPSQWQMQYKELSFYARLSPFKHTGIFPEQSIQWNWIDKKIKQETQKYSSNACTEQSECEMRSPTSKSSHIRSNNKEINILNLFAYTGIASLVAAAAGAQVTHVDASKPTIGWFRDNLQASGLSDKPVRWILDDALKFAKRELKRDRKYDGIIMDPPAYGHGPGGEKWDFNTNFPELLHVCRQLLSDHPLFVLVNAYAISSSSIMLNNILDQELGNLGGTIDYGELALQEQNKGRLLSTGIFGRWSK